MKGLGRARGIKPILTDDPCLILRIKAKIVSLYHRLLIPMTVSIFPKPSVKLDPYVGVVITPLEVSTYVR